MDAAGPGVDVGADVGARVAEHRAEIVVQPQLVGDEVPVPHHVVRGARHDLEALKALLQALLRADALGDALAQVLLGLRAGAPRARKLASAKDMLSARRCRSSVSPPRTRSFRSAAAKTRRRALPSRKAGHTAPAPRWCG
jgi:hypothetical protein